MTISSEYSLALRELAVKNFVTANHRSPSDAELIQLIVDVEKTYYAVDDIGISGFDIIKPTFRGGSSVVIENKNRQALYCDFMTLNQKLDRLINIEEEAFRGASNTINRANKTLDELLERLDNLLLIYGKDDLFLHGIEETFSHQLYIDRTNTTASVEPANATIGKRRLDVIDLSKAKIKVTPISDKGFISFEANSSVDSLKEDDGNIWQAKVKTTYQLGRVSLLLEIVFPSPADISIAKISCLPVEVNKIMTSTLFYSTNGSAFTPVLPAEQRLTPSMIIPIATSGIKKIQLLLSKEAADISHTDINEYEYSFLLDKISFEQVSYEQADRSLLQTNAYSVIDTSGNPVYFSKATLRACTIEPKGTSVAFYISNDGATWYSVDHTGKSSAFVSFGDHTPDQAIGFVDDLLSQYALVEKLNLTEEFDSSSEAYLNSYVTTEYSDLVPARNVTIRRNLSISEGEVLGTSPGWILNESTYSTIAYIDNPEGRYIDLGPKGAILNGLAVTGEVWLKQGNNSFSTDVSNWLTLSEDMTTETALKAEDSLYPYNHKYLIEGYDYPGTFTGQKLYSGVDVYFGLDLHYISPEEFEALEDTILRYRVFTIEEVDDKLFFKVKVDKQSSTWKNEAFDLDFVVQSTETNELYVRAVLSTNDSTLTPTIESFKVRVV